jgi:hypothetical protein
MANAPLNGDGMAGDIVLICPTGEAEYFFRKGWTSKFVGRSVICPSGKSDDLNHAPGDAINT